MSGNPYARMSSFEIESVEEKLELRESILKEVKSKVKDIMETVSEVLEFDEEVFWSAENLMDIVNERLSQIDDCLTDCYSVDHDREFNREYREV